MAHVDSGNCLSALQVSVVLGTIVCLGLLIYYFATVEWYWPLVLFAVGSIVGGLLFSVLDAMLGQLVMSLLSFLAWPAAALWTYLIINGLRT